MCGMYRVQDYQESPSTVMSPAGKGKVVPSDRSHPLFSLMLSLLRGTPSQQAAMVLHYPWGRQSIRTWEEFRKLIQTPSRNRAYLSYCLDMYWEGESDKLNQLLGRYCRK